MGHRTVGTCSICGGAVVTPDIWLGVVPPTPECSSCGAHPRQAHGPVIDMQPRHPTLADVYIQSTGTSSNRIVVGGADHCIRPKFPSC